MTDLTESDDSSVSSTYHSDDGKVVSFLAKSYDLSSSDDSGDGREEGVASWISSDVISKTDCHKILSILWMDEKHIVERLYPLALISHMRINHSHIAQRVSEAVHDGVGFIYAPGVLPTTLKTQPEPIISHKVLYDAVVFTKSRPTLMITFTKCCESSRATDYNSQVAKSLMTKIKTKTNTELSVIHGVIHEDICKDRDVFRARLSEMEISTRIMSVTDVSHIPMEQFEDVIKHFFYLHLHQGMKESITLAVSKYKFEGLHVKA